MKCAYCEQPFECEPNQDACPGCRVNGACEDCGNAPATGDGHKPFLCGPCEATWIDNYSGPDEPDYGGVGITELSERAYRERTELRKRD